MTGTRNMVNCPCRIRIGGRNPVNDEAFADGFQEFVY